MRYLSGDAGCRRGFECANTHNYFEEPKENAVGSDYVPMKDLSAATPGSQDPDLDTRERLVRAAIEVFLEKGYGGTRVQDIARRAGFTSGALYVHFPSRTALLGEAIIREGQTIMSGLTEQLDGSGESRRP